MFICHKSKCCKPLWTIFGHTKALASRVPGASYTAPGPLFLGVDLKTGKQNFRADEKRLSEEQMKLVSLHWVVCKQFPGIRGELQGGVLEGFDLFFG